MADIRLGTSSFTATGWQGSFYPKGLRPADYLSYYAQHFDTVEIDSTFYATPNVSVVRSWNAKTPEGFLFAAKVPQEITHKRVLKDCDEEFKVFLTTMETLGEKLGPLLFQFGKFDKYAFKSVDDFLARLVPFLKRLPKEHKFAVEIRNKDWLVPKLADVLEEHGVALTLIDQGWMPRPLEMKDKFDLITADFTYVRWLGDRKGIEEKTTTWDKVIVDRQGDLSEWVSLLKKVQERRIMITHPQRARNWNQQPPPSCAARGVQSRAKSLGEQNESNNDRTHQCPDQQSQDQEDLFLAFLQKKSPLSRRCFPPGHTGLFFGFPNR